MNYISESANTTSLEQSQYPQSVIEAGVTGNEFAVNHASVVNARCVCQKYGKDSPLCFLILVRIQLLTYKCLLYADSFLSKQLMIHLSVLLVQCRFQ